MSRKKKLFFVLVLIAVLLAAGSLYRKNRQSRQADSADQSTAANQTNQNSSKQETPTSTVKTYTLEEVAAHGANPDSEECWTVIHGKVYDILEFATNSHPGGEFIFQACGRDATELFETRPMGSKTPHSAEARKILEKYYIGELKN